MGRVLPLALAVVSVMDSPTGSYSTAPRLLQGDHRKAVRLLQHFADDSPEGLDAGVWAADVALRLPSE
ncbi:hypothetical protein ACZ90_04240 [Streptomyces albus subsp. albus]|nr:hypothetical protein ADK33_25790 [Streptomyces griseus subsp. rhodochrous]KUJ70376.1 hypothetical protein ACZ90_04240 [Streptomyces albus subsp. albus]